ncbi:hypothetical protein RvY_00611-2 [Ramazzottius varieornatus]|uniref:Uncharacterized protein n=1 Tax=Ramazzottius varieornatus TaxID=947166 RepID=A0A1D1UN81_RAMVA|nr:hypothetical protein RvY_00611-2 [Ramazzottius varieornatus]
MVMTMRTTWKTRTQLKMMTTKTTTTKTPKRKEATMMTMMKRTPMTFLTMKMMMTMRNSSFWSQISPVAIRIHILEFCNGLMG